MRRLTSPKRHIIATYPLDPDAWTENRLTPDEGWWAAEAGGIRLSTVHAVGNYSVENYGYNIPQIQAIFVLKLPNAFNAVRTNCKLNFLHALLGNNTGACTIVLTDAYGNRTSKEFNTSPYQIFEQKSFRLGLGQGWSNENFNWTKVWTILIVSNLKPAPTGAASQFIDQFYFSWDEVGGTLTCYSIPTGKSGTMQYGGQTYNFKTPSVTPEMPVGIAIDVSIDPADFDHWEDGNINPARRVYIVEGNLNIMATYKQAITVKLTINSVDENGNNFPGLKEVKIEYQGVPQLLDVPFAGKVSKGSYTFTANPTTDREFLYWKKNGGSKLTTPSITVDVQTDTTLEIGWKRLGGPGSIVIPIIVGAAFIGMVILGKH